MTEPPPLSDPTSPEVLLTSPGLVRTTPGLVKTTLGLVKTTPGLKKTTPGLVEKTRHLPFTFSHPKLQDITVEICTVGDGVRPAPGRLTSDRLRYTNLSLLRNFITSNCRNARNF